MTVASASFLCCVVLAAAAWRPTSPYAGIVVGQAALPGPPLNEEPPDHFVDAWYDDDVGAQQQQQQQQWETLLEEAAAEESAAWEEPKSECDAPPTMLDCSDTEEGSALPDSDSDTDSCPGRR